MKKRIVISLLVVGLLCCFSVVYASQEYSFDLQYTGSVLKNVEKDANVMLIGDNAPLYQKVRIKVDVEGPGTPNIMAKDTNEMEIDIAKEGFWGPAEGFAVQGTFTNTTPVKVTFPEAGKYEITLSLVDVSNANNVIVTQSYTIDVLEEVPDHNTTNEITNVVMNEVNEMSNNANIEELPTTGTTIWEYMLYTVIVAVILGAGYMVIRRKKQEG